MFGYEIQHDDHERIERLLLAALAANRARRCRLTETRLDGPAPEPEYLGESHRSWSVAMKPGPRVQITVDFEPRFLTDRATDEAVTPEPPALPCGVIEAEFIDDAEGR
jgi:hypothetical protein